MKIYSVILIKYECDRWVERQNIDSIHHTIWKMKHEIGACACWQSYIQ